MMWKGWGWGLWAVAPVLGLAFHFGPGQGLIQRDLAVDKMAIAVKVEADAMRLQEIAYAAQLRTLEARKQTLENESETQRAKLEKLLAEEQQAYTAASDAWKAAAERYQEVESLLAGSREANQVRWLRGRALVRAGEVFNGIEELQATLDQALLDASAIRRSSPLQDKNSELITAAREELAAAHYYGARLLREEGRATDVWRQVSETSRQQFRYLAEQSSQQSNSQVATSLQRNLERVLDLEQQDRSELVGRPIPKESPRARRPGDGEPGKRPGVGPPRGDQPANGASGMMEIGAGW